MRPLFRRNLQPFSRSRSHPGMRSAVLLAALAHTAVFAAAAAAKTPSIGTTAHLEDRYRERRVAFPQGVTSLADVTYSALSGEAASPAAANDIAAAPRWLRANASHYSIDNQRIGIWDVSAGGEANSTCGYWRRSQLHRCNTRGHARRANSSIAHFCQSGNQRRPYVIVTVT